VTYKSPIRLLIPLYDSLICRGDCGLFVESCLVCLVALSSFSVLLIEHYSLHRHNRHNINAMHSTVHLPFAMYRSQIFPLDYDLHPECSHLRCFRIVRCVMSVFSLPLTGLQCIPKIILQRSPICFPRSRGNLYTFHHRVESVTVLNWTM
jgi:hypothetical protein